MMISKRAFETKCGESNNSVKQKWISPATKISKQQAVALNPNRTTTPAISTTMQKRQAKEKEAIAFRQQAASNSSNRNSANSSYGSKLLPSPPPPPSSSTNAPMMNTRQGLSTPAKNFSSNNRQEQQQKLIKKAFVRFEDYLDLNEENMRRSCKKLMNHLYSEPTTNVTSVAPFGPVAEAAAPLVAVEPISCQSQSVPTNDQCLTGQSTGASNDNENLASSNSIVPVSTAAATQQYQPSISPLTATNGKSYLRSQYERRQLRQMQLVSKVQHEKVKMFEHVNGGANVSLDQQDLVERSHELSKRRFFEKLERRESMKNLNLTSTQTHELHQSAASKKQQPTDQERKRPQETSKQKRVAAAALSTADDASAITTNSDQLLLRVYQPITLEGSVSEEKRTDQEAKNGTLGRLDGSQAVACCDNKELAGELIGFYTPSLQSPAAAAEREQLIEISDEQIKQGQHQQSEETISKNATLARLAESGVGRSAFEIKVPPSSASFSSSSRPDEFMSSGLLVIKQVDSDSTHAGSLLQVADDSVGGLPNLSRSAVVKATTQPASNKTTAPLVEFSDNNAFSAPTEQINDQMTNTKTMLSAREFASDQNKLVASKLTDNDNQLQAVGISSTISCRNNNTEIETISSEETTGKFQRGTSESSVGQSSEQEPAIEFCGASNQAEVHDAPEMGIHVGQSGGTDGNTAAANAAATITNLNSSHPVQTQGAAQMQQQQAVGPQTTITKAEIRDVLPEATNEINRIEKIVSAEENTTEEVTRIGEQQTNEVHRQQQHRGALHETFTFENIGEYANPAARVNEMQRVDNVNHDSSGVKTIAENIGLIGGDSNLIESLAKNSKLVEKKSSTGSSLEEDGSSCSSSGCGASVSVTGSSDGCSASINVAVGPQHESSDFKRPISQGNKIRNGPECNPLYDSVRTSHWPRSQIADQYPDYKQLVGPDQAYPHRKMTLVENHCYASVLTNSDSGSFGADKALHEREFGGYANLPRDKAPLVEYATIHPIGENGNKKRLQNSYSETSLSNHSYSTSTANSGGFSALPPAKAECSATNNCESSNSLVDVPERKSSLFKRFGSLVSKAFSSTAAQSVTSKIEDSAQQMENGGNTGSHNYCSSKPALVIEKDPQVVEGTRDRAQLDEADLVILPTKHVNQRRQTQIQQQGKNPTAELRHDDRLSRGRKHSRKVEQSSATSTSSSSYSSASSYDARHHIERPKRTDSLSDELESLMSRSESNYRIQGSKLFRIRASSSNKNQQTKAGRRIDIDCVSPTKNTDERSQPLENSKSSNSPRSLLRLFGSSSSQRAAESTPNLTNSLSRRRLSTQLEISANNHGYADEHQTQLASGFWGLSGLIGNNHAIKGESSANEIAISKANRKSRTIKLDQNPEAGDYSVYASLQPYAAGYGLHPSSVLPREHGQETLDKYQSLSLYQNLLRNYTKRRHRHHGHGHHHHHHHHHPHNHHRAHHHSSHRHAHHTARCAQSCGQQNCNLSSSSTSLSYRNDEKFVVWGQLIKINKLDGSQVIELQRSPGKPWGFFVARGAINNTKGVFISRMHDNVTSNSLTGLLSIGDRILAIDECPIEPDCDILRVNQLISKKSKILLTVKPFKG